jgi:hypothetical protein
MNLPKLNPKESLMDCSVVENFIGREGKRERDVIFRYTFSILFPTYVFFLIQCLRIPLFLVQYPLSLSFCPSTSHILMLCWFDSTMTEIFNTALCEVKITLNIELTWQPPSIPGQSESLLAKAIQWQLHHGSIGRSDSDKEDETYSKHYHYQCTENRA